MSSRDDRGNNAERGSPTLDKANAEAALAGQRRRAFGAAAVGIVATVSLIVVSSGGADDGWVSLLQLCALGGWMASVWLAGRLCRWRRWVGHSGWHAGRCKLIEGDRFGWRVAVVEPPLLAGCRGRGGGGWGGGGGVPAPPLLAGTYDHSDIFRGRLPSPPTEGFVWIVRGSRRKVLLLSPGSLVVRQVRLASRGGPCARREMYGRR